MKRRINNLHKGMFKLNKTSNIIELHSKKNYQEKEKENINNININQYKYINNKENIIPKSKDISKYEKHEKKRKSSFNKEKDKEKEVNILENSFSDLESSKTKSVINSKLYNNYRKNGKYFTKLRQQVIDKFISGKPLISIDRMYNNPEVQRMFGVVNNSNNSEKNNHKNNNSTEPNMNMNNYSEENDFQRDRRIPPSKFLPMMIPNITNNDNILPLPYNDNINNINLGQNYFLNDFSQENNLGLNINNNFNNIKNIEQIPEINEFDFNTMNKMKPLFIKKQNNAPNLKPVYIPILYNPPQKANIFEQKNNFDFIRNNKVLNPINDLNNKNQFDLFEFNNNKNEFRRKRRSDNENLNNYMMQFNGANDDINNLNNINSNEHDFNEQENIDNLIKNLKRANDKNFNVFSKMRNNEDYYNNIILKKDNDSNNFINYMNNPESINTNLE